MFICDGIGCGRPGRHGAQPAAGAGHARTALCLRRLGGECRTQWVGAGAKAPAAAPQQASEGTEENETLPYYHVVVSFVSSQ